MTNHQIITLQKDIRTATTATDINIHYVLDELYPRAIQALSTVESVEDVNIIRHGLEAIVTITNRNLPKHTKTRIEKLRKANKGNDLYLQACRAAGCMWAATEKYRGRPPDNEREEIELIEESVQSGTLLPKLTAEEAGFTCTRDAQRCVKAAQIHDEDYRTYKQECDQNGRQYTLTGLESVYNHLNPKEKETPKTPLHKRLSSTAEKILEWREETEDDVYDLMTIGWEALSNAAEIVKSKDDPVS